MNGCLDIFDKLNGAIVDANNEIIKNMTNESTNYLDACIKPFLTFDYYNEYLKKRWDNILNEIINSKECPENLYTKANKLINTFYGSEDYYFKNSLFGSPDQKKIMTDNLATTMENIADIITTYCRCYVLQFFRLLANKYKRRYTQKFDNKSKTEILQILQSDYEKFQKQIVSMFKDRNIPHNTRFLNKIGTNIAKIASFSIDSELNTLIPDELGPLKQFFIKIITRYYENIHPVIWAQIFKSMVENIFIELPFTPSEIFSFGSKHLLLNSGPFILKILQMTRPIMTPEQAKKYNLTKLTYPLLEPHQVNLILERCIPDWSSYKIVANYSASVGHVCKVVRFDKPDDYIIVKIIKPLAIVQSCWEYKTLHDLYEPGTCESSFIIRMLESNGRELNINNENENIEKGHKYYTANYSDIFDDSNVDIRASLTTVKHIPNIINSNIWFATAMTLAPGLPLSRLIESNELEKDTKYRARLHRCLDLLVYKFFNNIFMNGFYHGDLHSGNIFFSYQKAQATIIDFGAVSEIDVFSQDPEIVSLTKVLVMSSFHNYPGMLDEITDLVNKKCTDTTIDKNSTEYAHIRGILEEYRIQNMQNEENEKRKLSQYKNMVFDAERVRIEFENDDIEKVENDATDKEQTIYSLLKKKNKTPDDVIIENRDVLAIPISVEESESVSFNKVLEEIIKFYSRSGVNIAIKFNELYELQKAYALLIGVLHKVNYSSYRTSLMIRRSIFNVRSFTKITNFNTMINSIKQYFNEKSEKNKFIESHKNLLR